MLFATLVSMLVSITSTAAYKISATPHDQYSSSVGVLGCHVNTNRIAYFPNPVDCTNICVRASANGRSVTLLRLDQSGGGYDMSYDAWNYLVTGRSARDHPVAGGAIAADVKNVPVSECLGLIHTPGRKLPLSAANSMNYLASCVAQNGWVGNNYLLYNIQNPTCTLGYDEVCSINLAAGQNQATCPHPLGSNRRLTSAPVWNIMYPTGQIVQAT